MIEGEWPDLTQLGQDIIPIVMSALLIDTALAVANTNQPWRSQQAEKQVIVGEA